MCRLERLVDIMVDICICLSGIRLGVRMCIPDVVGLTGAALTPPSAPLCDCRSHNVVVERIHADGYAVMLAYSSFPTSLRDD